MPASDLRTRLQRLRLQKVKRDLPPSVPLEVVAARSQAKKSDAQAPTPAALPGAEVLTRLGTYHLIENHYPLDFAHGPRRLAEALECDPRTAALLTNDETLAEADPRGLVFLDTETTGLAGGAGTLAFLIGVGMYEGEQFILRQYFLRDPAEEEALLTALVDDLAPRAGWVTFNGRAFDLPLLETRLTLSRQRGALGRKPHLDLLFPARRLYRGRLESCSLGHLEQHVFNIVREQDDVPGYLIPQLYQDYLRTGDPSEMHRVIYHNAMDILSMVTLTAHVLEIFATRVETSNFKGQTSNFKVQNSGGQSPISNLRPLASNLRPEDLLRLAYWHDDKDRPAEAEAAYRGALEGQLDLEARRAGLVRFAALLKRQDRRAEAAPLWEQLASFTLDDPEPFVELAKYYEWHAQDLPLALQWAERALAVVGSWPRGWQRSQAKAELERRVERLRAKRGSESQ
jgi:hypothetical protein